MRTFIIRRLLLALLTLFLASVLLFGSIRLLPGDAVSAATNPSVAEGVSKDQARTLRRELGLDDPIAVQYWDWVSGILRGDMGKSSFSGRPVRELVQQSVPVSIELAVLAIVFGVLTGFTPGLVGAVARESSADYASRLAATFSIPSVERAPVVCSDRAVARLHDQAVTAPSTRCPRSVPAA